MSKPTVTDCAGCYNDFYNHREGQPGCWYLESATMVSALDVPVDMPPPYLRLKPTTRPSCYKKHREVRVKYEALTVKGYWR